MKSISILILAAALAVATVSAMPQRRLKSQRQVEYASTPYPAAGFRPRIPFALPSEQQPKLEAEPLTTPSAVETLENAETTTTEVAQQQEAETETEAELEVALRTPANTYGAPDDQQDQDTVEVVAQAPARDFQPPVLEAVEDFAADGAATADGQQPVADVPALGQGEEEARQLDEPEPEPIPTDVEVKAVTPAGTYGPPPSPKPASTYGAPELSEPENELDLEESQVELVGEQEELEGLDGSLANELASGRLILLPLGSQGAQFGRLILAVEQPRQRSRSERLRRI
ncbi:uncharacterized protein [Drosophila pseudoobscura]|uniref:DUF4794 domain-containing protein n=1 Tax=Drosophila pseudoobscura pseudoobscura TaxID=46245 RepID=A0A6I8UD13_DROPS|nr:uncharacterized protein LOC4812812 [Drosophila pseudoobscura]